MWASAKRSRSQLWKPAAARKTAVFSVDISFALNISLPPETSFGEAPATTPQALVFDQ
jgi:hypothetical protein